MLRELFESLLTRIEAGTVKPTTEAIPYNPTRAVVTARRTAPGAYDLVTLPQGKPERPARMHVFHDVESFAAYVRKHMPDGATVEILAGPKMMQAIDAARWAADRVTCDLTVHPDLLAWEKILGQAVSQKTLASKLTRVGHTIVKDGANAVGLMEQLRSIKIDATAGTEHTLDDKLMHTLDASTSGATIRTRLDSRHIVECPIYLGEAPRRFTLALTINDGGEKLSFQLDAVDLEIVKLDAYRDQVGKLRSLLGEQYLVGMGDLALGSEATA